MKAKKIVAILLAVVAVAMVGVGIYFMNSSKYIFKTALSGVLDYAIDAYDEMTDSLDEFSEFEKYKLNTTNSLTMLGEEYVSINGDVYVDSKADKTYVNLDSKIAGADFVGIEGLLAEEKIYIKIKEAMEDFYYEELEITDVSIEELSDDEFKLLMNHVKDSILKDVEDKDLEKTSKTIKLGDKNYKTTQVSLKVSEKRTVKILENLLTAISKDNKAIQILQKYEKTITKEAIEELVKVLKENSSELSNDEIFTLSFYVEGFGGLRRVEISTPTGDVDSVASSAAITYDIFNNKNKQKTYLLTVKEGNTELLTFKFEYASKSKANVVAKVSEYEVSGTYVKTNNSVSYNLSLIAEGETLGTLIYEDSVVKKDKEYKLEIKFEIPDVIELTSINTLLIDEKMPNVDVSDAVAYEEMSEEDQEAIDEYVNEKLEELGLSSGDDYYDDYYWDEDSDLDGDEAYDTYYYEEITADEVEDLMDSAEPMVLWFGSQSCSHCKNFAEVLDESWVDYWYDIYYIDINDLTESDRDTLEALDSRLNVTATPTTVVLQDGKIKAIKSGAMTKDDYYAFLDENGVE